MADGLMGEICYSILLCFLLVLYIPNIGIVFVHLKFLVKIVLSSLKFFDVTSLFNIVIILVVNVTL